MTDKYNFLQSPSFSLSGQLNALNGSAGNSDGWGPLAEGGGDWMASALSDPSTSLQDKIALAGLQQQGGFNTGMLEKMGALNKPPSPWTTGTQMFGNVAQGLAGLGNIYLGFQGMKQQKKAFEFNKGVTNTNLNNSISDYNRRLNDTLQNRALNNGQGNGWVSEQLSKYSAKRS